MRIGVREERRGEMSDKLKKWEPSADAFAWCREDTPIEDDDNSLRVTVSMKELRNKDAEIARLKEEALVSEDLYNHGIEIARKHQADAIKLRQENAALREKVEKAGEEVIMAIDAYAKFQGVWMAHMLAAKQILMEK
jgi:hypothetical protein